MAVVDLALVFAWLVSVAGIRGYLHARRTGEVAIGVADRRGSPQWWSRSISSLGLLLAIAAPIAALAGLPPIAILDHRVINAIGVGLVVLGIFIMACRQAPRLDLKFFVHHGQYVRGRIAGHDELAGTSIILVHRLLKGSTAQAAHGDDGRASGFAVFTGEAVDHLGLDPAEAKLRSGSETIEHLGEVVTWTLDLEARWRAESEQRRVTVADGQALLDLDITVPAPPAVVWARLTTPSLRPSWEGTTVISQSALDGRRGVGTTAQCVTGRLATLEEIVDWQPYDHVAIG